MNLQPPNTPEEGAERKLAAVMFTDIKGFSRKMAENESAAFDLLKKHDALLRVLSNKYGGKVVKSIGDSFMVDFASAVNAVKCAVEAQTKFHAHNKSLSELEKIEIRVGIHLGDVLISAGDIFGDGVNIASRIESIAEPTRICISADVYNQIRKKMELEVFKIGGMKLKNIPEPVEVFEILIPSIEEFSKPSDRAKELSRKQSIEATEKHAARVERTAAQATPSAHVSLLGMTEDQKKKQAEEMYERAEKYFQMGRIDEAESELKKIDELFPKFQPSDDKRKHDEENETKAQTYLTKARDLVSAGKLEEAEAETRKVFEYYPLHIGAQQILLRIEEERYKKEEEERSKRASEQRQDSRLVEEQREVAELLAKANQLLKEDQFTEAVYTIHELYKVDPNNLEARELEKTIQTAQKEKAEKDKLAAEEEERRLEEERELARQRRREEAQRVTEKVERPAQRRKIPVKTILSIIGVVALVVLVYLAIPPIMRALFPVRATIASLGFTGPDGNPFTGALPIVIIDDLSQVHNVTTRGTVSSSRLDLKSLGPAGSAASLGVTHVIGGSIDSVENGLELTLRLFDVRQQQSILARKIALSVSRLAETRREISRSVIESIGLDAEPPDIRQQNESDDAYSVLLTARALLELDSYESLQSARYMLDTLLSGGMDFPSAQAALAESYARLARMGAMSDESLEAAVGLAQQAVRSEPTKQEVIRSSGVVFLTAGRYEQAFAALSRAKELRPQHPESYRQLAELWLIAGDREKSRLELATAITIDPLNPRTLFLQGLVAHVGGEDVEATRQYEAAIASGGNRAYILSTVLASSWLRGSKRDAVISYFQSLTDVRPDDYRLKYYLGRAYDVKLDSATMVFSVGLEMCRVALELSPADQRALAFQSLILTRMGKFPEALSTLALLEQQSPADPSLQYRIANVYALQNKKEEALRALSVAVDRKFAWSEVLNPDFATLFNEPEFRQRAFRPFKTAP